jgi:hypothetical protein
MNANRVKAVIASVCMLAAVAAAQPSPTSAPPPAQLPPATPVMQMIPAGTMGFLVTTGVEKTASDIETFLSAAGATEMMGMPPEAGWLLQMIGGQAMLGEGFNPAGGLAVVMLDPQQFGVDLSAMAGLTPDDEPPAGEQKLPVVIIVPGQSIESVFSNYQITPGEPFATVGLRMGPMLAAAVGGYVVLSPRSDALQAVLDAKTKAGDAIPKAQLAELAGADLGIYVNMKVAGPIVVRMMGDLEKKMPSSMPGGGMNPADMVALYKQIYGDIIKQMTDATLGLRFTENGLVVAGRCAFDPESEWGQVITSYQPSGGKLLDRVPNINYVLAYGVSLAGSPEKLRELSNSMMSKMFGLKMFSGISPEVRQKLIELSRKGSEQQTGAQLVIGGAPEGAGLFGLSILLEFKDAAEGMDLLNSGFEAYAQMYSQMSFGPMIDLSQLKLVPTKDAETVMDLPVETVEIKLPQLDEMSDDERAKMTQALGEDKLMFRVAKINDKDVALTFGGGQPMMAAAIEAARSGGTVMQSVSTTKAMSYMPTRPVGMMLFDAGHLMTLVKGAVATLSPDAPPLPFDVTTNEPVALGLGVEGAEVHSALFVPSELVKQVVQAVAAAMTPHAPPPTTSDDEGF